MVAEIAKKGKKKGTDPKDFKNCVIFIAEKYYPWQEETLKVLADIGFDEQFEIKAKAADVLKGMDSLKSKFKDVMKFQSFVIQEVKEEESLIPLNLDIPFD